MIRSSLLLIAILMLSAVNAQQETAWPAAAEVEGAPYHSVEELRSFYKLTTGVKQTQKGSYAIGNADISLELGPGTREMRIGGLQVALARPLQKDVNGRWLISREDWLTCIEPILRPTYIHGREEVKTIVLDPGHGGHDTGEQTPQLKEAEVTLQVARKLKAELEKLGYTVLLTRDEDFFLSDQQRVEIAHAAGAHTIFLSLHVNSGRSDFNGAAVYTLAPGTDARPGHAKQAAHAALGYALQSALIAGTGAADAGCRRAHFSLLSALHCPAAWVELGYATHAQEGAKLAAAVYQDTLAQALAQGVATYAHVANPTTAIPVQTPPQRVPVKQPVATPSKSSGDTASRSNSSRKPSTAKPQPTRKTSSGKQSSPSSSSNTRKQTTTPAKSRR